jgi:hypothetical protein
MAAVHLFGNTGSSSLVLRVIEFACMLRLQSKLSEPPWAFTNFGVYVKCGPSGLQLPSLSTSDLGRFK